MPSLRKKNNGTQLSIWVKVLYKRTKYAWIPGRAIAKDVLLNKGGGGGARPNLYQHCFNVQKIFSPPPKKVVAEAS